MRGIPCLSGGFLPLWWGCFAEGAKTPFLPQATLLVSFVKNPKAIQGNIYLTQSAKIWIASLLFFCPNKCGCFCQRSSPKKKAKCCFCMHTKCEKCETFPWPNCWFFVKKAALTKKQGTPRKFPCSGGPLVQTKKSFSHAISVQQKNVGQL